LRESSPSVQPSSGEAAARKVLQKLQAENLRLEALRDFKRATRIFNELEEEVRAHGLKDKG
jgi:hypothetical protein